MQKLFGCLFIISLATFSQATEWHESWVTGVRSGIETNEFEKIWPLVHNDQVIFAEPAEGKLIIADLHDGSIIRSLVWPVAISGGLSGSESGFVFTDADGNVVYMDWSLELVWQTPLEQLVLVPAAIDAGYVVVQSKDDKVIALDERSGQVQWLLGTDQAVSGRIGNAQPYIHRTSAVVIIGSSDGELKAVDITTGELVWNLSLQAKSGTYPINDIDYPITVQGDDLVASAVNGDTVLINLAENDLRWQQDIDAASAVLFVEDTLYFIDSHNELVAMDHKGVVQQRWPLDLNGSVSTWGYDGEDFVVATATSTLYTISTEGLIKGQSSLYLGNVFHLPVWNAQQMVMLTDAGLLYLLEKN